jgi:DNA polymerase Ligase (LigD)
MPRFVILEHDHPELHWDFMLEVGSVLKTWRLAKAPEFKEEAITAQPLGDHRLFYLDYEGPVSGARGKVTRWDAGTYEPLATEAGQEFHVLLEGNRVQGPAVMEWHEGGWVFGTGR